MQEEQLHKFTYFYDLLSCFLSAISIHKRQNIGFFNSVVLTLREIRISTETRMIKLLNSPKSKAIWFFFDGSGCTFILLQYFDDLLLNPLIPFFISRYL